MSFATVALIFIISTVLPLLSQENPEILTNRFTLSENGHVIIDSQNKLMWEQSGSSYLLVGDGIQAYVDSLNRVGYAGYKDWRLPSLAEAISLMTPKLTDNNLLIDPLFDSQQAWIFTSDIDEEAWPYVVYYTSGKISSEPLSYLGSFIRLVRNASKLDYPSYSHAKK